MSLDNKALRVSIDNGLDWSCSFVVISYDNIIIMCSHFSEWHY